MPAPPEGSRWFIRLHTILVVMLVLGGFGLALALLANILGAFPGGGRVFGMTGLWLPDAKVRLDGAVTSGTSVTSTMVEVSLGNRGQAPTIALLTLLTWLPGTMTIYWAVLLLSRIVSPQTGYGDHSLFSERTATCLHRIGKVMIWGSLAAFVLDFCAKTAAAHMLLQHNSLLPGALAWPFAGVLTGVGAHVVAVVIRRGLTLLDELRGTI
ncbi:hypothetical protein ACWEN6_11345 [Sphaerisporangium sp. NPDC004334]